MDATTPELYETPAYLRSVVPLDPHALALVEEGEVRELAPREVLGLELAVLAACQRVRAARRARDGHD